MNAELSRLLDALKVSGSLRTQFEALYEQQGSPKHTDARPEDETLGRYQNLGELGRGGMAVVQRVQDAELNRQLAMKIIDKGLLENEGALTRFVNEAQMLSQLQHPNIVPVHEIGRLDDGRYYFTMKEVKGKPLSEIIQSVHEVSRDSHWESSEEGWSLRRLMSVFTRICAAVAFAHSRGVIHRDLKPDNVLIGDFDQVLVSDWGIAKIMGGPTLDGEHADTVRVTDASAFETKMGVIAGTPAYMAPEQARGEIANIDERTDIYALGAILYEMLSGRPPYTGTSQHQILGRVLSGPPPSVRSTVLDTTRVTETIEFDLFADLDEDTEEEAVAESLDDATLPIPEELAQACEKSMHRLKDRRFGQVDELQGIVQDWIEGVKLRDKALAIVNQVAEIDDKRETLLEEASLLSAQAAEKGGTLTPASPEAQLAPVWALEDQAASLERNAAILETRREQLLQGALTHKPDLAEAHEQLIMHYQKLHRVAESAGDSEAVSHAELRAQTHLQALHSEHPTRLEAEDYFKGEGTVSLVTYPVGAQVFLSRYETVNRRLEPTEERLLGVTPLNHLPVGMGSYQLRIAHEGYEEVIYPIHIQRQEHWGGTDPDGFAQPIWLPPKGAISDNECYVPAGFFVCGNDPGAPLKLPDGRVWTDGFIVNRYPVTNRDIITWLNALSKQGLEAELEAAIPRPRTAQGEVGHTCFDRQADGTFKLIADEAGVTPELDYPVVMVTWHQTQAYLEWLNAQSEHTWRLLHELEWEKAARGVDGRIYPWGNHFAASWCCMEESNEQKALEVVTSRPLDRSPYGVVGLAGHVFEWTSHPFRPDQGLPDDHRCPSGTAACEAGQPMAFRGGSWHSINMFSHAAMRWGFAGIEPWPMLGFRIARSLPGSDS